MCPFQKVFLGQWCAVQNGWKAEDVPLLRCVKLLGSWGRTSVTGLSPHEQEVGRSYWQRCPLLSLG